MPLNKRPDYGQFRVGKERSILFGLFKNEQPEEMVIVENGDLKNVPIGTGIDKGFLTISQYEDRGSRVSVMPDYFSPFNKVQDHLTSVFGFETASNINFPNKNPVELKVPHILGSTKVKITRLK